jgi:hypothetical protein
MPVTKRLTVLGSQADLLQLSSIGKVISFVKKWDPKMHPRGYGGMFVETPDARKQHPFHLKPGDIVATPGGHVYNIAVPGQPGVNGGYAQGYVVDPDTGVIEGETHNIDPVHVPSVAVIGHVSGDAPDGPEPLTLDKLRYSMPPPSPEFDRIIDFLFESDWNRDGGVGKRLYDKRGMRQKAWSWALHDGATLESWTNFVNGMDMLHPGGTHGPKPSVDKLDSISTQSARAHAEYFRRLRILITKDRLPDPSSAAVIAVGDWLGQEWDRGGVGQPHRLASFLSRFEGLGSEDTEISDNDIVREVKGVAPYLNDDLLMWARHEATKARLAAISQTGDRTPPLPSHALTSARKHGVTKFMKDWVVDTWVGGEIDFEHLLSGSTTDRKAWLENYMPTEDIPIATIDDALTDAMNEMDKTIEDAVKEAKRDWRRRFEDRASGGAEKHSVPLLSSKDLFEALSEELDSDNPDIYKLDPSLDEKWSGRNSLSRQLVHDMAVGHLQPPEMWDHDAGQFNVPRWENVDFEEQTPEKIESLIDEARERYLDVPVFFTGGMMTDGVMQFGENNDKPYANGMVPLEFDLQMTRTLQRAGAQQDTNSQNLGEIFGYPGSGELYAGMMLELSDGEEWMDTSARAKSDALMDELRDAVTAQTLQNFHHHELRKLVEDIQSDPQYDKTTPEGLRRRFDRIHRAYQHIHDAHIIGDDKKSDFATKMAHIVEHGAHAPSPKRIEYVPHDQPGDLSPDYQGLTTGAPTSQRGQLRLYGYTPEEAIRRLRELGIIEGLEPEVPYTSLMRGNRRHGRVLPLHPDYVRGDQKGLPQIRRRISHGVTGGHADLISILDTGAILPISERVRLGMTRRVMSSTSQKGDVRSGLDRGVFGKVGRSTWGNTVVVFKDDAYLRRDVIVSPTDYGAGASRYDSYRDYKNEIRANAGLSARTNLESPLEPAARQWHLASHLPADNEWNLVGGIPIEDWRMIYIPNEGDAEEVRAKLRHLYERGLIAEIPKVVTRKLHLEMTIDLKSKKDDELPDDSEIAPQLIEDGELVDA